MNVLRQETVTQDQENSLTLVEVLNIASSGYMDDFLKEYYREETGEINRAGSGNTLAEFIVLEIRDTFDATLPKSDQLTEVGRVLRRAIACIQSVVDAVEKA